MTGSAAPDWSKPLDYYKWTMALAVAAVVYVPDRFLPAAGLRFAAAAVAFALLAGSCVLGFLLFGGIVRRLSGRSAERPSDRSLDAVGFFHLAALAGGFLIAVALYCVDSFFQKAAPSACRIEIQADTGSVAFDLDTCTLARGT